MTTAATRPTRRRKLVFATAAVLLCLGLLEAAARIAEIWRPPQAVDIGAGFLPMSRVFVPSAQDPAMLETAEAKRVSFLTQSFPARKPPGTLRIVALGASSVNYADTEFAVLARHVFENQEFGYPRVEFINAGGAAYGSDRIRIVAMELLGYDPDVVLLYEAHNEFEEVEQLQFASIGTVGVQRTLSRSAAVRLFRDLVASREIERLREEHERRRARADQLPDEARAWHHDFTQEDVDRRMKALHDNYAAIIEACKARNVAIVLGTVPSNLVRPALPYEDFVVYQPVWDLLGAQRYDEARELGRKLLAGFTARHQSSDRENAVLRGLAKDHDVPLADVEAAIVAAEPHHMPGETLFKDHCHLNDRGNAILRETFEKVVVELLRARASAAERSPAEHR